MHFYCTGLKLRTIFICPPGVCFSKAPETFRVRKASFTSSVSKNGEAYAPETSCMKETFVHLRICE